MQFARLNVFGEEVGKPTDKPTSKIGQNNQRLVGVLYGHEGSGKVYNYLAGENVRTGDIVTPMVTHPKSNKDYKTLGRVMTTSDSLGTPAQNSTGNLPAGTMLKTLGTTDQKSLPGYYKGWGNDAKAAKELFAEARAGGASQSKLKEVKTFTTGVRKETKQKYDDNKMQRLNTMGNIAKGR